MERLTEKKRNFDGTAISKEILVEQGLLTEYCSDVITKLADYEDAEEQGLLLRLPCKVGDTVYKLWYKPCHNGEDFPDSYSCYGCKDECDIKREISEYTVPCIKWIVNNLDNFGKSVWFLAKEEVEAKLKEMESE